MSTPARSGLLSVSHQGQFPAVTLTFNLRPGVALGEAVDAINEAARDIRMPSSIIPTFQGNAQAFQNSLSSEPILIAAALIVVYIILGMLYESFIHPLTILSTLPSAGVGALLALQARQHGPVGDRHHRHHPADRHRQEERHHAGRLRHQRRARAAICRRDEAIREACLLRFRPILMTTAAAMLAGVPLALGHGTGSELRQPLGYAMVGGLAFSQVLTLYTTPVVYLYLDRFQQWLNRKTGTRQDRRRGIADRGGIAAALSRPVRVRSAPARHPARPRSSPASGCGTR